MTPSRAGQPPFWTLLLPWLSLVVAAITFVGLLGGFHPPDSERDTTVLISLVLVVLLQVPALIAMSGRLGTSSTSVGGQIALLVLRLIVSIPPILFAGSISHEGRGERESDSVRSLETAP